MNPAVVIALARRLVATPDDQPLLLLDRKNDLDVALWEFDYLSIHGHACPQCDGIGTIRLRGKPGYVRVPCPRCGGSGTVKAPR